MTLKYKVASLRSASCVSQLGALRRLESADGSRWAHSRNRKLSLGNGRYDIVESWVLKHRVNGKVEVVNGDAYEADAKKWVGQA